ncbi:hypothetical protein ACFYYB_33475 [Streptomyces sp. NPDC002886]|uniref:hypothetical protein n=1 Tax=Streptomyces sp. NPDC002886 TaxID=3364667 RepID=UPI003679086A
MASPTPTRCAAPPSCSAGPPQSSRLLTHLGGGCSTCAVREGVSVDTTMGMPPLEGRPMSSRSGSVDPGMLLWLQTEAGMGPRRLAEVLMRESGLFGVSGSSGDTRKLVRAWQAGDADAALALDVFTLGNRLPHPGGGGLPCASPWVSLNTWAPLTLPNAAVFPLHRIPWEATPIWRISCARRTQPCADGFGVGKGCPVDRHGTALAGLQLSEMDGLPVCGNGKRTLGRSVRLNRPAVPWPGKPLMSCGKLRAPVGQARAPLGAQHGRQVSGLEARTTDEGLQQLRRRFVSLGAAHRFRATLPEDRPAVELRSSSSSLPKRLNPQSRPSSSRSAGYGARAQDPFSDQYTHPTSFPAISSRSSS